MFYTERCLALSGSSLEKLPPCHKMKGPANDPAELADSPTEVEQSLSVKSAVMPSGQGRTWNRSARRTECSCPIHCMWACKYETSSAHPLNCHKHKPKRNHPSLQRSCTKMLGFKWSGPIVNILTPNSVAKQESTSKPLVTNELGGSQSSSKGKQPPHHKTYILKPLQSFPDNQRGAKDWKAIKKDLPHLWISHTSEARWPHCGTETDLLLKGFQSQVSLEHFWAWLHLYFWSESLTWMILWYFQGYKNIS